MKPFYGKKIYKLKYISWSDSVGFLFPPFLPTFRCSHPQDLIHNFLLANRAYIFLSYVLIYKSLRNGDVLRRFLADPH